MSLGEDGALAVDDSVFWVPAPTVTPVNTTGAGDAMLAGYLSAADADYPRTARAAMRRGVAWAAAAAAGRPAADADETSVPLACSPDRLRRLR